MFKSPQKPAQTPAPEYTSDWFSMHIPAWQSFFGSIDWPADTPKTVIEIGCFEGRASVWMLDNLLQHPDGRLYCVDPFPQNASYSCHFDHNIRASGKEGQVIKKAMTSFEFLSKFVNTQQRADFIYLDGSHRAADVLEDLVLGFRSLRIGGLMICDDYLGGDPTEGGVLSNAKISIDAFTTICRDRLRILSPQPLYQLAFVKTEEPSSDFSGPHCES